MMKPTFHVFLLAIMMGLFLCSAALAEEVTIQSQADIDGQLMQDVTGLITLVNSSSIIFKVGEDSGSSYSSRGFVSFDLPTTPDDMIVDDVVLRVYQSAVSASSPYTDLYSDAQTNSTIIVDHLAYGSGLDTSDYDLTALTENVGTLSETSTLEWKELNVKSQVVADMNALRTRSQFRLRFTPLENNGDSTTSYATFITGDGHSPPELIVTYIPPIPTLSEWGLLLLSLMLGFVFVYKTRVRI